MPYFIHPNYLNSGSESDNIEETGRGNGNTAKNKDLIAIQKTMKKAIKEHHKKFGEGSPVAVPILDVNKTAGQHIPIDLINTER